MYLHLIFWRWKTKLAPLLISLVFVGLVSPSLPAQIITTIAGGTNGDGGLATSASLNFPASVAFDATGNLYIGEVGNNRIRKVDATSGKITTVAGTGPIGANINDLTAASTDVFEIGGVATDSSGNLYIAANVRIRKIAAASGLISTVAGNGYSSNRGLPNFFNGDNIPATTALFGRADAVTVDSLGDFYVADALLHRIRKVSASSGIITTIAGTSSFGYNGDNIAGTDSRLNTPQGVAVDLLGNVYVADTGNHRVRKIAAVTGVITTVGGTGVPGYDGDDVVATNARLNGPVSVAVDNAGNLYIADRANNRVRRIASSTGIITTVAGTGSNVYNGDNIAATIASVAPSGVAISPSGDLYIPEAGNKRVRRVSMATGLITTIAGNGSLDYNGENIPTSSAALYRPGNVSVDASGNIFFAEPLSNRVRKITKATGKITTVAGTGLTGFSGDNGDATKAALNSPGGIAVSSSGDVYFSDALNNRVRKVSVATGTILTVAGTGVPGYNADGIAATSSHLNLPIALAIDSSGNLFISDALNNRVRKVSASNGAITTVAGSTSAGYNGDGIAATDAWLKQPLGVAVDASGNLYIGDTGNNRIRKVAADTGMISTVAGNGATFSGVRIADGILATDATLLSPTRVAVDLIGNLYFLDATDSVRKVITSTGVFTTIAGYGVCCGGFRGDNIVATSSGLGSAEGLAVDTNGDVFVAATYDDRIRKVAVSASAAAVPNYQGLWWNAPGGSEAGWGINFAHQGNTLFATWFTYDATGKALWLTMNGNRLGNDYIGTLYQTRGPAFSAVPFSPTSVTATPVGSGILTFTDANIGQFNYIMAGTNQTKQITRQVFGPLPNCTFSALPNASNYQDLWWAAPAGVESGWGVNFTHQGDTIFATWFTYDADGTPLWLSATATKTGFGVYSGIIYRTTGPSFNAVPFLSANVSRTVVGTLSLNFINGNNGNFAYTLFGITQSKAITRQVFSMPTTFCQ